MVAFGVVAVASGLATYFLKYKPNPRAIARRVDRLGLEESYTEYLGNKVVCHNIPIRPGRSLAIICECAAVNHRQKKMGYNAAQELYQRVQNSLSKRRDEDEEE